MTYLLFLKMADERAALLTHHQTPIPPGYDWKSLVVDLKGEELETHYHVTLAALGQQPGLLGLIFRRARSKVQNPAMLRRLITDLIGSENWSMMGTDVKGDAYEGLLEKNAEDAKSGAGQYFTPRALINAIVEVMRPKPVAGC